MSLLPQLSRDEETNSVKTDFSLTLSLSASSLANKIAGFTIKILFF